MKADNMSTDDRWVGEFEARMKAVEEQGKSMDGKLDTLIQGGGQLLGAMESIKKEMSHKVGDADLAEKLSDMRDKIRVEHRDACPVRGENSGVFNLPARAMSTTEKAHSSKPSGVFRVDISGISPVWQRILLSVGTLVVGVLGYLSSKF